MDKIKILTPSIKRSLDKLITEFLETKEAKDVIRLNPDKEKAKERFTRVFEKSFLSKQPACLTYVLQQLPNYL